MLRVVLRLMLALALSACARDRVEVIRQDEAYLAFANVKEQILDYQNHMEWLAANPDKDEVLIERNGRSIYCGRPGGIRLDITSATANLNLEATSGGSLNATSTGTGGALTSSTFGLGRSGTSSISYNYVIEIGERLVPRQGGTTPLARNLLTLRNNFMKSQYELQSLGRGCLNWVPGDGNYATVKLVKTNNASAGAFFALGPLVINPGASESRSLANTITVTFALSPQLTDRGTPAPRAGSTVQKAGKSEQERGGGVPFGGTAQIGQEGMISMPMGVTATPVPLFPTQ